MLALKGSLLAASGAIAAWLTGMAPQPADELYFVVARGSGKCLQQSGATLNDGDGIAQWTCANRDNFKLRKIDRPDGSFSLQFAHSGKCVNLSGQSSDVLLHGLALKQGECGDRPNARWRARQASDGYVYLLSEASRKCINLHGGIKTDGEVITQSDCAKRPDMMWKLVPTK